MPERRWFRRRSLEYPSAAEIAALRLTARLVARNDEIQGTTALFDDSVYVIHGKRNGNSQRPETSASHFCLALEGRLRIAQRFHRWENMPPTGQSPGGTIEGMPHMPICSGFKRPYGTRRGCALRRPTDESVGYCRVSLRDSGRDLSLSGQKQTWTKLRCTGQKRAGVFVVDRVPLLWIGKFKFGGSRQDRREPLTYSRTLGGQRQETVS